MTDPKEPDESTGRKMDPELKVMAAMLRLLDELPERTAQARVVGWLSNRFLFDLRRPEVTLQETK